MLRKVILLVILIILFSCTTEPDETRSITITGYVYKLNTNEAISNVTVSAVGPTLSRTTTYSVADGNYKLKHSWYTGESGPDIIVDYHKDGFISERYTIDEAVDGKTYTYNIWLKSYYPD